MPAVVSPTLNPKQIPRETPGQLNFLSSLKDSPPLQAQCVVSRFFKHYGKHFLNGTIHPLSPGESEELSQTCALFQRANHLA